MHPRSFARSSAAAFLAQNRGGGLFSELVSQRVAAWVALSSYRLGLRPSALTVVGLLLGVGTSVALLALAPVTTSGTAPAIAVGLAVGAGWQIAYVFDCADGQLARTTGQTSTSGARLDILSDVAVQISVVTAISSVAAAHTPTAPAWLYAIFAGTWMVNLVTSALAGGPATGSLIAGRSGLIRAIKLTRDYGAVIAACALIVAFAPRWTVWLMVAMSTLNGGFLLASIAQAGRGSLFVGPGSRDT